MKKRKSKTKPLPFALNVPEPDIQEMENLQAAVYSLVADMALRFQGKPEDLPTIDNVPCVQKVRTRNWTVILSPRMLLHGETNNPLHWHLVIAQRDPMHAKGTRIIPTGKWTEEAKLLAVATAHMVARQLGDGQHYVMQRQDIGVLMTFPVLPVHRAIAAAHCVLEASLNGMGIVGIALPLGGSVELLEAKGDLDILAARPCMNPKAYFAPMQANVTVPQSCEECGPCRACAASQTENRRIIRDIIAETATAMGGSTFEVAIEEEKKDNEK